MREADRLPAIADALRRAGRRWGTPLYLTDLVGLDQDAHRLAAAFPDPWIRQFSLKANDVPAVVREVLARGFGPNVVSRGEWVLARRAGAADDEVTLEGVGKTDADLRAAVRAAAAGRPLRWLAVESMDELDALTRAARAAGLGRNGRPALDVLVRLNPSVTPETHRGLAVGSGGSKFGLAADEATAVVERASAEPGLRPRGVHLHIGSQLGAVDAWRDGVRRALALLGLLSGTLRSFDTLDVGGGFAVPPDGRPAPGPERFARELSALLRETAPDRRPSRLAVEPGRAVVARSGWLVASVLHVRERGGRQVVIDVGMTELIRPALYGAVHPIVALTSLGRPVTAWPDDAASLEPTRVEGPICESTDALGSHPLPALRRGDLVAIRDAGAYAASQSSSYNGRQQPPQVLLDPDGSLRLGRRRGRLAASF